MKKALAMLLTLAMLFSCLVVGVAEEAAYCPPYSLEDCDESWINYEEVFEDGTHYVVTYHEGVNAFYFDGELDYYYYFNEAGNQCNSFNWNHELSHIEINVENEWFYSYDGGETWVWYDHENGEDVPVELPEGVEVEDLPALGESIEFEVKLVQNIEEVDTRFGDIYDLVDGEGNPAGKIFRTDHMSMSFDNEGKLTQYSYSNEDYSQYVYYTADNELLYVDYYTEDGKTNYFYNGETWVMFDTETWEGTELDELPEGVEIDILPPLGAEAPRSRRSGIPTTPWALWA